MDLQRPLKFLARFREKVHRGIDATQIVVSKMIVVVTLGRSGFHQPGDGLLVLRLFDEISSDVVVGIPEIWIDLDRSLAFGDRVVKFSLKAVGPTEESVGFGRGV